MMNSVGMNSKNIVNDVNIFNDSVAMNIIGRTLCSVNNIGMNNVSCEYYQDEQ